MAIKVYKGGSWVNTTGLSAIGKADRLAIGQTNTSPLSADKAYYLSFVDANHEHTSRQYEDFYTGIGITFSPISNALSVGGNILSNGSLYLTGTSTDENGDIHSFGGLDGHFGIFNEGAGPLWLSVKDSNNTTLVGIVSFSSDSGSNFAARQSIFQSNINPRVTDTYDIGESAQLQWNNVYANCFHGDGTGLTGTGSWEPDNKENLKAGTNAGAGINNHTCYNIFIGYESGKNTASTAGGTDNDGIADENIFIGRCSGHSNTTGGYNVFGGSHSGFCNLTGNSNVAIGHSAGYCNSSGDANIFLGHCAGRYSTTGSDNIFMGYQAGYCNRVHNNNIFLGFYSGKRITGVDNIALGYSSLLGGASGENANTGQGNIAIGCATGKLLNDGNHSYNVFLGGFAGQGQKKGSCNIVIGYNAQTACQDGTDACTSKQLAIGINADNWLSGDSSFNIRPGRGIIDSTGSCGTDNQVLTSHKVAGTPDNYYVKWATNVSQATSANELKITENEIANTNTDTHYIWFGDDSTKDNYDGMQIDKNALVYKGGRFGVGTNDPQALLHIQNAGPQLQWSDSTDNSDSKIRYNSPNFIIEADSNNEAEDSNISFRIDGPLVHPNEKLRITQQGHVGIGTTNPISDEIATSLGTNNSVLAVGIVTAKEYYGTFKGTISPDASITLDKIQEGDTSAEVVDTGTDGHFKVLTDGTERLRIDDAGISTFSSDVALIARFQRIGNTDGKWAKVDIKANTIDGNSYLTFSDSAATEVGAINYEHNDDTLRFEVWDRDQTNPQRRSRLQIGNLGQIGLYDDTSGTSNDYGDSDDVLTSQGPNAKPIWKAVSGIPASTSVQVKVTKVNDDTRYYLTGVTATNTGEATTVDKTLYQNMPGAPKDTHLYMKPSSGMLFLKNIRGDIVDPTGKTWPETNGDLKIVTSNFIPDTNSTTVDSNGNPTNGQNLGGPSNKFATVYAQKFDGLLGGTADKAKQLEVQKNESSGTGHYFGMITGAGENGSPSNQTFYTDTSLTYNPSSDILTALNIEVSTKLHVKGNTVLGDDLAYDTVTWYARSNTILPSGDIDSENYTSQDLGSGTRGWNTIYAKTFNGALGGTATRSSSVLSDTVSDDKDYVLTFIDWVSSEGTQVYKPLKFDADGTTYNPLSNVLTTPNLAVSGITTLGTSITGNNPDTTKFNSHIVSNITPGGTVTTPGDYTVYNLGESARRWNTVYAKSFDGAFTGSIEKINTASSEDENTTYLTFTTTSPTDSERGSFLLVNPHLKFRSNATSPGEKLTVDCQLDVTGDASFAEDVTLGSGDAADKVTFNSKIAAPLTLGIGQILPYSPANEAKTAGIDLGGSSAYWKTIYAREFKGAITGNATSASALNPGATINLTSGTYDATHDFSSAGTIKFTGASNYEVTAQLNNTGVTATTYGNNTGTSYARFTVDAKGRIKSASTQAISLTGLTADKAKQVQTITSTSANAHYLTFVDSNTSTATAKNVYTDGTLKYTPSTDTLAVSKFVPTGSFPTTAGKIPTTKQVGGNITWEWGDGTASGIGRNYTLPLTVSGTSGNTSATWTLTDNASTPNTDPITIKAGTGLKIDSTGNEVLAGTFTISMDTSSNTAFKYKNTYATNANTTNKADAVLQIYPSAGNAANDQKITLTPGSGIKFSNYGAQALTIESDADVGASTVDLGKTSDINHANPWHFVFADSRDGGSETLYVDDESSVPIKYNNDTDELQTTNLYVTGNTILGDALADADTVTWNARSGTILPSGTSGTKDLGSSTYKWGTVHANTITGSLSIDTNNTEVLYTKTVGGNKVAAGTGEFTFTETTSKNTLKVTHTDAVGSGGYIRASSKDDANFVEINCDAGIEICRTITNTGGDGGAYLDFKDNAADDYGARIQLTTHVAGGGWNQDNDRGGLLFQTGGENNRHMLLTKNGVLGITTYNGLSAIKTNDGSNHENYFVPGIPRDADLNDAHNIDQHVVLDVNGTLMLRANFENGQTIANGREGAQLVFNNSDDTVGFSVDVYGSSANNSTLRIINEKKIIGSRGTQRFAMNQDGAITFKTYSGAQDGTHNASNVNADYGSSNDVLTSQGHGSYPIWKSLSALGAGGLTVNVRYHTGGFAVYTPTTGTKFIRVQVIGPGGGGGGLDADSEESMWSGSGGGGGYCEAYIKITSGNGTMVYQCATGGPGGAIGQPGSGGGISMFWTNYGTNDQICMQACGGEGGERAGEDGNSWNAIHPGRLSGDGGQGLYVKGGISVYGVPPSSGGGALPNWINYIYLSRGGQGVNNYTTKKRYPGPPSGITYQSWDLDGGGSSGMGGYTYGYGGHGCYDNSSYNRVGGDGTDGIVIVTEFGDF
jgi:hypothetical protein